MVMSPPIFWRILLNTYVTCDCGRSYIPNPKYNDPRVKCDDCIKKVKTHTVKKRAVEFLGGKCKDCQYAGPAVAFDFDHRNPQTKRFNISSKLRYFRWSELRKELQKCILRCANCHRVRHHVEMNPEMYTLKVSA